jgi:general stress protein YciG
MNNQPTLNKAAQLLGTKGGRQTAATHNHEHYVEIGRRGGKAKLKNKVAAEA